jgi:double zinc ribbon protein
MTTCTSCGNNVTGKNFCSNCGAPTRTSAGYSAPAPLTCARCGGQNDPGVRFCNNCGNQLASGTPGNPYLQANYAEAPYQQQPAGYPGSPTGYTSYQHPYGHQVPGQSQMVLCCPTCQTVSAVGTPYCQGCHSSLIGVSPTPVHVPGHSSEVHIHHHHGQPAPYRQPGHYSQYGQHGYPYRRRGDSGPLDGMGGMLAAGAGGLVGGLILGEVAEEIFDDD